MCALIAILKMSRLPQAAYFYLVCNQRYYFSLPILAESFMMRGRNFTCKNLSQYKMVLGEYDVALLSDLTTERVSVLLRNVMLLDVVFLIDMLLS